MLGWNSLHTTASPHLATDSSLCRDEFNSKIKNPSKAFLPSTGSNNFKMAPRVGFEPTTLRLTAGCSAAELSRNIFGKFKLTNFRFVSSASAWPCRCLFGGNLYGCSAAELSRNIMWQRPILPAGHPASTFGALKLNFCVRNENRWILQAIVTTMVI